MEVIFKGDLLVMKIKITYLILSPLVICYFGPILIFDLDHFFGDLPYLCLQIATQSSTFTRPTLRHWRARGSRGCCKFTRIGFNPALIQFEFNTLLKIRQLSSCSLGTALNSAPELDQVPRRARRCLL